jgi:hypothetical protein
MIVYVIMAEAKYTDIPRRYRSYFLFAFVRSFTMIIETGYNPKRYIHVK